MTRSEYLVILGDRPGRRTGKNTRRKRCWKRYFSGSDGKNDKSTSTDESEIRGFGEAESVGSRGIQKRYQVAESKTERSRKTAF